MKGKIIFILVVVASVVVLGIQPGMSKGEETRQDSAKITLKLDKILANQAEILKQFEEIKQELAIIKVRASR